jgi:hypothetical protein
MEFDGTNYLAVWADDRALQGAKIDPATGVRP